MGYDRTPLPNFRKDWQELTSDSTRRYVWKSLTTWKFRPGFLWKTINFSPFQKVLVGVTFSAYLWCFFNTDKVARFIWACIPRYGQNSKNNAVYAFMTRLDVDARKRAYMRNLESGWKELDYFKSDIIQRHRISHYRDYNLWLDTLDRLDGFERDWVIRRGTPNNAFRLTPNLNQ